MAKHWQWYSVAIATEKAPILAPTSMTIPSAGTKHGTNVCEQIVRSLCANATAA